MIPTKRDEYNQARVARDIEAETIVGVLVLLAIATYVILRGLTFDDIGALLYQWLEKGF